MTARWPSFLLVGAARSGTSALFSFLGQHPGIFTPSVKEPHFFAFRGRALDFRGPGDDTLNQRGVTDEASYLRLFERAGPERQAGEASVSYLYYPEAAAEIRRTIPEVKILVILRDPTERAFSSYQYMQAMLREPASSFAEALRQEPERIAAGWQHIWHYRALGLYHSQLGRFYATFDPSQILPVLHEDLRDRPAETLARVFDFLGVESDPRIDTSGRINASGRPRSRGLVRHFVLSSPWKRALLSLLPTAVRTRIVSSLRARLLNRESIPPTEEAQLRREYAPEVTALAKLIQRDLDAWLPRASAKSASAPSARDADTSPKPPG